MTHRWLGIVGLVLPALLGGQTGRGPYARIAVLRPLDGQTVEFEAGYIRHLAWHRQAGDPWAWYGWASGPGSDTAGSSTGRSGIRPPAWTAPWPRRTTSGTTFSTSPRTSSMWRTRSTSTCRGCRVATASRSQPRGSS